MNLVNDSFCEEAPCKKAVLKMAFNGIHSVANTLKKHRPESGQDISLKSIRLRPSFSEVSRDHRMSGDETFDGYESKLLESLAAPMSPEQVDSNTFIPDFIEDDAFGVNGRRLRRSRVTASQLDPARPPGQSWQFLGDAHRIPANVIYSIFVFNFQSIYLINFHYFREQILSNIRDNSNRRQYGMGLVGKLLNRRFRNNLTAEEKRQLHSHPDDYRPYFTYWVTIVQIVIMFISLCSYGFGPVGFTKVKISAHVFVTSLSIQQVDYFESNNIWLGPRAVRPLSSTKNKVNVNNVDNSICSFQSQI
jgi:hypothetical protein